jgi:hypothetical protein
MPSPEESSHTEQQPSEESRRKLWLEYLGRLNDRELQSTRASGATTWVLLAVAAAIIYRAVPQLPRFFSVPEALTETAVIWALTLDSLLFFLIALVGLIEYCTGGKEGRVLPELQKRAEWVLVWSMFCLTIVLVLVHVWLCLKLNRRDFAWWTLVGFAILWAWSQISVISIRWKKIHDARKYRIPTPSFSVTSTFPDFRALICAALLFPIGVVPCLALVAYIRALSLQGVDWVLPLGAAAQCLALMAILIALGVRGLEDVSRGIYRDLERDIVLEELTPAEIKSRFIAYALGVSIADWFKGVHMQLDESHSKLKALVQSTELRLREIDSISAVYGLERKGRASALLKEFNAGTEEYGLALRGYVTQMKEFLRIHHRWQDIEPLESTVREYKARLESMRAEAESLKPLRQKLEGLTRG